MICSVFTVRYPSRRLGNTIVPTMQSFPLIEGSQVTVYNDSLADGDIGENIGQYISLRRRGNSSLTCLPSPIKEEDDHENTVFCGDAGNKANDHYKSRLSPLRFKLRSWCLPVVRKETQILADLQAKIRYPVLDFYFAWTASLASHTFYVLMLPPLFWFGSSNMGRDLVAVLGLGIYFTSFCKDLLCLPRPRSPPLHRLTVLAYTAEEYGWPSSHSANATAVSLVLMFLLMQIKETMSPFKYYSLLSLLFVYYFSLVFGRLYCGMHGFLDVITGALIGVMVFLFRHILGDLFDTWLLNSATRNSSYWGIASTALMIIMGHSFLIHIYPEPVDDCPCFDDSVAFMGVLIGQDLSHYYCILTDYYTPRNVYGDPLLIPFSSDCGLLIMIARFVLGLGLVLLWKTLLKPIIFTLLPPIYKFLGVNLPRSHFISTAHTKKPTSTICRQSLSNMKNELMAEIDHVLETIPRDERDTVGPQGDIDAYELLDYQSKNSQGQIPVKISGVFKLRYDVEIVGRLIIYAGISVSAIVGVGYGVIFLNLI